jgi:Reverse transcriptase (RNA-dependent DNA polymerase)
MSSPNELLDDLLRKGYLPRELPPPFVSTTWADFAVNKWALLPQGLDKKKKPYVADVCTHTLDKPGGTRRTLGIPNPISQMLLCQVLATGWEQLAARMEAGDKPRFSASRPVHWKSVRALIPRYKLQEKIKLRLRSRRSARYVLHTDISQFYGSIYTHSLPWALHSKPTAKAKRNDMSLLGNRIDRALRNGHDGQTVGIPIGPDSSLLVAETLLRAVDDSLRNSAGTPIVGFRYIDDIELSFTSLGVAERVVGIIEAILHGYELALNPKKTRIEEVPSPLESPWVENLREATPYKTIDERGVRKLSAIAFELASRYPQDSVLKFAIACVGSATPKDDRSAQYLQSFAFNAISASPTAVSRALDLLVTLETTGHPVNREILADVLNAQLARYVELARENEIAWALWGALAFGVKLSLPPGIEAIEDDVVALLALDGQSRNLWTIDTPVWAEWMNEDELQARHWLVAYEANVKGWLPTIAGGDHVGNHQTFATLKANGVSFYDSTRAALVRPPAATAAPGGTIGEFYA